MNNIRLRIAMIASLMIIMSLLNILVTKLLDPSIVYTTNQVFGINWLKYMMIITTTWFVLELNKWFRTYR